MKELRKLFQQEDRLITKLAEVRAKQQEARKIYAKQNNLLMLPRMETLRNA